MAATHWIKKGDTGRKFTDTLKSGTAALNLTGASVKFIMKNFCSGTVRSGDATVTDATAGKVSYQPTADDVGTVGRFLCEWEITYVGGKKQSVPEDGYIDLRVMPDLA